MDVDTTLLNRQRCLLTDKEILWVEEGTEAVPLSWKHDMGGLGDLALFSAPASDHGELIAPLNIVCF